LPFDFLIRLRDAGVLLEDCVTPAANLKFPKDLLTAAVFVSGDRESPTWQVGDSFIAAIRLARDWMVSDNRLDELRLAVKGGSLHRDLRTGNLSGYRGSICLVPEPRPGLGGTKELLEMAAELHKGSGAPVRLIFFGISAEFRQELLESPVRVFDFKISEE